MFLNRVGARGRALSAVLISLAALCAAAAQQAPAPVDTKDVPKALAPVVQAELSFAAAARAKGMKDAFIEYAAPDGLIFRRTAVNAREAWRQTNPAPTGLLSWYPIYADVSRAGDLGYTTGPWELRDKPTDEKASGHGHFVTLWRRQPDGTWRFALDMGVRHAAPPAPETELKYPSSARKGGGAGSEKEEEAARSAILEAEKELAADASANGVGPALAARASDEIRLYRQNAFPRVGKQAAQPILDNEVGRITFRPTAAFASRSGELGYAYGIYDTGSQPDAGHYLRIWKRQGVKWRVVLEVTNPAPPPRQ